MPNKPASPCRKQGCPQLTKDLSGYCPQHLRELRYYQDKDRGSAASRGYNRRWQKVSKIFLKEHPLCAECMKNEIIKAAEVVDHITPPRGDLELFWDESNWQPLCIECHNIKTAKKDGGFGNK